MFNEYGVFQMMKFRQEETERNASDAWKRYADTSDKNDLKDLAAVSTLVDPCCQCACA
ncbi:hypothetical protein V7137_23365 [Neobacillus drentensis]